MEMLGLNTFVPLKKSAKKLLILKLWQQAAARIVQVPENLAGLVRLIMLMHYLHGIVSLLTL